MLLSKKLSNSALIMFMFQDEHVRAKRIYVLQPPAPVSTFDFSDGVIMEQ